MNATARHFWRCDDCLIAFAIEGGAPGSNLAPRGAMCGACWGTSFSHMGRVKAERLVRDAHESPCDARCTHARGPKCDCPCRGANHGSGVTVRVEVDAGGVPRVTYADHAERDRAAARAEAFRILRDEAAAVLPPANADWTGRAASRREWEFRHFVRRAHRRACTMKAHGARMTALRRVLAAAAAGADGAWAGALAGTASAADCVTG